MKKKSSTLKTMLMGWLVFAASSSLIAQQTISGSFTSNGQTRTYIGAMPNNPQASLRLVILFCGVGENASQMALRGFNDYLGTNSMVIYPEPSSPIGFDNVNGVDDFQMVEDLIHRVDSIYTIDTNDICIGGFSNGGIFTYKLACEFNSSNSGRPYKFKAIAVVSGAMESGTANSMDCPIVNNLPLIAFHGTQDPIIQYNGGQVQPPVNILAESAETTVNFWALSNNGCSANPIVTSLPDIATEAPNPSTVELLEYNCTSSRPTKFYRIVGGRHAWPSGNANIDNSQSRNLDINASELIAGFFNNQTTVSITEENLNDQTFSVYPNPFNDLLSIESNLDIKKVVIVNTLGSPVYTETQPNNSIFLEHLSSGVYFLIIEDESGGINVMKIIKE
jgi:polyhydroxybutyrate depolymerase